ncbi:MAG TPA: gluconate 2-dehydrogenase subunit 3 family protein [Syntrophales bacterium]|nr:gluconate 2-dehydrogenase subunit 3 family protein [Syntrophales bacterium]
MPLTREDLQGYMENWDAPTRRIIEERMEAGFTRERLELFTPDEAALLKSVLDRLIPQDEGERVDLVGFLDWAVGKPLGRGDRREGMPPEEDLFRKGLSGIEGSAQAAFGKRFAELGGDEQDRLLTAVQEGSAPGPVWDEIPSSCFFSVLLTKALTGYCAHPLVWLRMGFPGPSYPEGYVWITGMEIQQRRRRFPGWKTF